MMRCVFCQDEVFNDARFCQSCGQPVYPLTTDGESGNDPTVYIQPFPGQWQIVPQQGLAHPGGVPMVQGTPSMLNNAPSPAGEAYSTPSSAPSPASPSVFQGGQASHGAPRTLPSNAAPRILPSQHQFMPNPNHPQQGLPPPSTAAATSKMVVGPVAKWLIIALASGILAVGGVKALPLILSHGSTATGSSSSSNSQAITRTTGQPTPTPTPSQPTPTPTPSGGVLTIGTWQGQGTYYSGQSRFDMLLKITDVNSNTFSGTLEETAYNSVVAIRGSFTSSGNKVTIIFTDYQTISGGQIQLDCTYTATVSNGQMSGVWSYPGHSSPDGGLSLSKTA